MNLGLQGRVALVTGGSEGMGFAIARELVAEGARVAIAARNQKRVEAAAQEVGARPYVFDSNDLDGVAGLVDAIESDIGTIDIYIANTGGPPRNPDPLGFSREQWETAHRTLVLSPMEFLKRLLPGMCARSWGRVVGISSSSIREPIPGLQLSNTHRPGVIAGFKVLARQVAGDGVTINTILPGRIATERALEAFDSVEQMEDAARNQIPAQRLGAPEEIAAATVFLCSARASYVTGTTLLVDGGLTTSL